MATTRTMPQSESVRSEIRDIVRQFAQLMRLQAELLSVEFRRVSRSAGTIAAMSIVSTVFLFAGTNFAGWTACYLLVEQAGWALWQAALLMAGFLLFGGGILSYLGWRRSAALRGAFAASREEWEQNLRWLDEIMHDGSNGSRQN